MKTINSTTVKRIAIGIFALAWLALPGATVAQVKKIVRQRIAVKIYLQKTEIDPAGSTSLEIVPVTRRVFASATPLHAALEQLFKPVPARETARRLSTPTLGTQLEGFSLKNGTALVRFSEPPDEPASANMEIFIRAIERTAKQFAGVRRVHICAIGETLIDSESGNPFPRCPPAHRKYTQ